MSRLLATLAGRPASAALGAEGEAELALSVPTEGAGLLVLDVSLAPHDIELAPGKVAEYFEEARPPRSVVRAWRVQPGGPWRESYVKNARALSCVRRCAGDASAMRPSGTHLEFVALSPGPRPRAVRLLAAGRPLVGRSVEIFDARGLRARRVTDAAGALRLDLPLRGRAMVSTVWLRPPAVPGDRFESDFASLTFDAR